MENTRKILKKKQLTLMEVIRIEVVFSFFLLSFLKFAYSQNIDNMRIRFDDLPLLIEINQNNHGILQYKEIVYIHSAKVDSISFGYNVVVTIRSLRGKTLDTMFVLNEYQINTLNNFETNIKSGFSEENVKFAGWDAYYRIYSLGKVVEFNLSNFYSLYNAFMRKNELPWNK